MSAFRMMRALGVLTLVALAACDPGYRLRPVAWAPGPDTYEWHRTFDQFAMRTRGLGGLVGEWQVDATYEVSDNPEPITLKVATLRTAVGTHVGTVRRATAPPGGGVIGASWRFDENHRAPEVLGDVAEIVLDIDVGADARTIRIEYQRAK